MKQITVGVVMREAHSSALLFPTHFQVELLDIGNIFRRARWMVWQVIVLMEKNNSAALENIFPSLSNMSFFAACASCRHNQMDFWTGLEKFRHLLFHEI
jgi:hypothetical protein